MQRLQDEVATLKEALKMRGEVGALQEEIIQVSGTHLSQLKMLEQISKDGEISMKLLIQAAKKQGSEAQYHLYALAQVSYETARECSSLSMC